MFLQVSVCPQGGIPACLAGGIPARLAAGLWGVCSQGGWGGLLPGGAWRPPGKQTATVADSTHPTGMHSRFQANFILVLFPTHHSTSTVYGYN